MGDRTISSIISENPQFEPISPILVNTIRNELNFKLFQPIHTFATTEIQRNARVDFCKYHINNQTNWENVLFTDESSFELDSSVVDYGEGLENHLQMYSIQQINITKRS